MTDFAGTPMGGFHDDLAHELLALDDLEQPLQYLLPLGRRPQQAQDPAGRGDGTSASRAS